MNDTNQSKGNQMDMDKVFLNLATSSTDEMIAFLEAPIYTPKPIQYAPATWKCGHVDEWPVNMLKNNRHLVEAKACPECRAIAQQAVEKELAELRAIQRENAYKELEARAEANGITVDQQELREYFAANGCE